MRLLHSSLVAALREVVGRDVAGRLLHFRPDAAYFYKKDPRAGTVVTVQSGGEFACGV